MVWRRMPAFFANVPLKLMRLTEEQLRQIRETGWLPEAAFKTAVNVNKVEIKTLLEQVYHLPVDKVTTMNYMGQKKRWISPKGRAYYYRLPDWKKVYVRFKPLPGGQTTQQ